MASFGFVWRHLASFDVNFLLNCNLPIFNFYVFDIIWCTNIPIWWQFFTKLNTTNLNFYLFGIIWHPKIPIWRQFFIWIEYYLFEFISFCTHLASMFTKLNTTHLNFYLFSLIWRHLASIFTITVLHIWIFKYLAFFGIHKYPLSVISKNWASFGVIWRRFASFCVLWRHLALFGVIWRRLA